MTIVIAIAAVAIPYWQHDMLPYLQTDQTKRPTDHCLVPSHEIVLCTENTIVYSVATQPNVVEKKQKKKSIAKREEQQ